MHTKTVKRAEHEQQDTLSPRLKACGGLPSEVASSEHLCNARAFFQRQLETKESREQTLKGDTEGVFSLRKFLDFWYRSTSVIIW